MRISEALRATGSPFWYLATFAALDLAVWAYLRANGANLVSTALLVVAAASFVAAALTTERPLRSVGSVASVIVGLQLVLRTLVPFRPEPPLPDLVFHVIPLAALLVLGVGVFLARGPDGSRRLAACMGVVALLGLGCRAAIVLLDVRPTFDVPLIQEAAAEAIRSGTDPYLTHIFDSGYPYLPVAAIGATIGSLFGDARWAIVAGDAMTLFGLGLLARRLGLSAVLGATLMALWAWWTGGMYVAWQGFPEPLLIGLLTLSIAVLAGSPRHRLLSGVFLGLSMATKQFALAMLPLLLASRHGRAVFVVALLTTGLIVTPFAAWHPPEFFEGTFWSLLAEPGRDYSLNLLVGPGFRLDPPYVPILLLALAAGWLVSRRVARIDADAGWLAGSACLLLIAFLANRIAFVNYYAIPMLVLIALVMLLSARVPDPAGVASVGGSVDDQTATRSKG